MDIFMEVLKWAGIVGGSIAFIVVAGIAYTIIKSGGVQ